MANLIQYICRDCGEIIDDYDAFRVYTEIHYELDQKIAERIVECRCPYCNSDNVERC